MTKPERNAKIIKAINERTKRGLRSRAAAREMLIAEGIYTKAGNLKAEFGGKGWRQKVGSLMP